MHRRPLTGLALAGALLLGACADVDSTSLLAPEASTENRAPAPGAASIAEIAIGAGFDELVGALSYVDAELGAGLVDLFLNGTDQFTVFAPTDEAFAELYALLTVVLGTPIDQVTDIPAPVVLDVLLYHVVEGRRAANSVLPRVGIRTVTSLLGETFRVRPDGSIQDGLTGLRNDAAIVEANNSARNGIIHIIDQVIVPPSVVGALTN